jgi:uncharacterized protein
MNDSSTPEQLAAERRVRRLLSAELAVQPRQVEAAVDLLDGGATVPFIARYRKEATDGLDDTQLRTLEERLIYLRDLESRRLAILASISEQGQMTDPLRIAIDAAVTKQALEDLYLPFKPRRRSRAQAARDYLRDSKNLSHDRLFLMAPRLPGPDDKLPASRVSFEVK